MFGMSIKPLEFTDTLTAEEIAKAEAIKADHMAFVGLLDPLAIAGLNQPSEDQQALIQSVAERQEALHNEIWDRVDPGAEKRQAHYDEQMKAAQEEFFAKMRAAQEANGGSEDDESYSVSKPSILSKVKSLFGR